MLVSALVVPGRAALECIVNGIHVDVAVAGGRGYGGCQFKSVEGYAGVVAGQVHEAVEGVGGRG